MKAARYLLQKWQRAKKKLHLNRRKKLCFHCIEFTRLDENLSGFLELEKIVNNTGFLGAMPNGNDFKCEMRAEAKALSPKFEKTLAAFEVFKVYLVNEVERR